MKLIDSKTYLNLAKAFAAECQAYVRYKFIEYGARFNKFENIAQIIDNIAYNEFNHARIIYTKIQSASKETIDNIDVCSGYPFREKWDLCENMKLASEDEHIEADEIYPEFAEIAKEEGFDDIATLFTQIGEIEKDHELIFANLYNQLKNDTLYENKKDKFWICSSCGYKMKGTEPWPDKCPVCQAERQSIKIEIET